MTSFTRRRPVGQVVFHNHVYAQAVLEQLTRAVAEAADQHDELRVVRILEFKRDVLHRYHETGELPVDLRERA